ncbi:MAG: cephalosporin hydroxylase family protein [Verrucomicrobiota bacterium]|nr:cephalosporin hydroxylase family protein [Verrucomicrobiota bacterium]
MDRALPKGIVFDRVQYRGVRALKNVFDLWVLQEILWETEPEVVVEIGVKHGGTTLWLSDVLRNFRGEHALVVGIDIEPPDRDFPDNVRIIAGDSIVPETVARVREICSGRRTMVMVDGRHDAPHVLQEMRLYGPMVSMGCYFLAEDGIVDVMDWKQATPGPLLAVQQFLTETDEFIVDAEREKFLLTYTPGGYLKRVRPATSNSA